jgi:hypothetical protein
MFFNNISGVSYIRSYLGIIYSLSMIQLVKKNDKKRIQIIH